jgi:hypothetical protein
MTLLLLLILAERIGGRRHLSSFGELLLLRAAWDCYPPRPGEVATSAAWGHLRSRGTAQLPNRAGCTACSVREDLLSGI